MIALSAALPFAAGCGDARHRLGDGPEAVEEVDGKALRVDLCRNGADLELIDDMEDGDFSFAANGRIGNWFPFNDETPDAVQIPRPRADVYEMRELDPPRGHSRVATGTSGSGFEIWGAGIGFDLYQRKRYDASAYAGIAFFGRDHTGRSPALRVEVTDRYSSPAGGVCDPDVLNDCYDSFGEDVVLSDEWQAFFLEWSDLERNHISAKELPKLNPGEIYGLRFQTSSQTVYESTIDFDFTIDDVAFLCHPIEP